MTIMLSPERARDACGFQPGRIRASRSARIAMPRLVLLVAFLSLSFPAFATEPYRQNSIALLQPESLLAQRVSADDLADYIKHLNEIALAQARAFPDHTPRTGSIVFAVRPDGSRKVWLDLRQALSEADSASMIAALEAPAPCPVREGTVVAAINVSFWGGKPPVISFPIPMPPEWRAAIKGDGVEVTALVDSIWPQRPTPGTSPEQTREN